MATMLNRTHGRFLVLATAMPLLAGCSTLEQEAEYSASVVADGVLTRELAEELDASGASTPAERVEVARGWLSTPDEEVLDTMNPVTWVVRGVEGSAVRVDVYSYVESGSLLPPDQGEARWGLVCRTYDVATAVTVREVECPDDTPTSPSL